MSIIARQSTARTVMVGPVMDADGVAVTDGVVGDFKISRNGAAPVALNASATATHRHSGHYSLALTSSDTDTVGSLQITCDDTVNAMPKETLTVIEEAVYDALFAASATGYSTFAGGAVASVTGNVGGNVVGSVGSVTAAVTAGTVSDKTGYSLSSAGIQAIWDALTSALTTASSIGKLLMDNINATISSRSSHSAADVWASGTRTLTSFDTLVADVATAVWGATTRILTAGTNIVLAKGTGVTGFNDLSAAQVNAEADQAISDAALATAASLATTDGKVDAIKAETDKLADTLEDDAGTYRFTTNALEQAPTGGSAPTAGEIADAVWDEPAADHVTSGTTGAALGAAGSAGDPWETSLPGAYAAGTAGKIIGDNLDAAVSSRLATAGYTAPDNASVTAIKAKTDNLPSDPADQSLIIAATNAIVADTEDIQVNLALVKAKTDNLPAAPAATGDIPSAAANASATRTELAIELGRLDEAVSTRATPAQVNEQVVDALTVDVVADSIPADGSRPTIAQALYLLTQFMLERSVSGTTLTVKKPDGSTTLLTLTLDDASAPTSVTRAS